MKRTLEKMNTGTLEPYVLIKFSKKSGRILKVLEANGSALLKLWALQNCTKSTNVVIFVKKSGKITYYAEGTDSGMPHILEDKGQFGNIEELAPGILAAVNTDD